VHEPGSDLRLGQDIDHRLEGRFRIDAGQPQRIHQVAQQLGSLGIDAAGAGEHIDDVIHHQHRRTFQYVDAPSVALFVGQSRRYVNQFIGVSGASSDRSSQIAVFYVEQYRRFPLSDRLFRQRAQQHALTHSRYAKDMNRHPMIGYNHGCLGFVGADHKATHAALSCLLICCCQ